MALAKLLSDLRTLIPGNAKHFSVPLRPSSRTWETRRLRLEPLECRVLLTEFTIIFDGTDIHLSAGSGTGGTYVIGDTLTVQWDSTAGGNTGITEVAATLGDLGQTVQATEEAGIWTATFELTAGNIAKTGFAVSFTASNGTTSSTGSVVVNAAIDTQAPIVTPRNIAIACSGSGGMQSDGSFVLLAGDTVTVTWDNNADGNTDIGSVAADFSVFGGSTVAATDNGNGTWSASYTSTSNTNVWAARLRIPVSVVDTAGNSATAVFTEAPTVTPDDIDVTGATGADGTFIIGNTVTVVWYSPVPEDNIGTVAVDFSDFGATDVITAQRRQDTPCVSWIATYTIQPGDIETSDASAVVSVSSCFPSSSAAVGNLSVDNKGITPTNITISGPARGTNGTFVAGDFVMIAGGVSSTDLDSVVVDLSAFGGGNAVTATTDSNGNWWTYFTIASGSIATSGVSLSVTMRDTDGNQTTTIAEAQSCPAEVPTVKSDDILVVGTPGTPHTFITGETITVVWRQWNIPMTGNSVETVTVDFSAFGATDTVTAQKMNDNPYSSTAAWFATYTIQSGDFETSDASVVVVASNSISTSSASVGNLSIDNKGVTPTNITISGVARGTNGTFVAGDTVTIAGGASSTDLDSVVVDLSPFGGSNAETATVDSNGNWSASFTLVSGSIDTSGVSLSVTMRDVAGNQTTTVSEAQSCPARVPTVISDDIHVFNAPGPNGTFIRGDTVSVMWNMYYDPAACEGVATVTVDFSDFGATEIVSAQRLHDGCWLATYTIQSGDIETSDASVVVVASNSISTSSASVGNLSIDNTSTTTTRFVMGIAPSGTDGSFIVGDMITVSGSTSSTDIGSVRVDLSAFGATELLTPTISGTDWSLSYTILPGTLDTSLSPISVIVRDVAGNESTFVADESPYLSIDNCVPAVTAANITVGADPDADGIYVGGDLVTVAWDNSEATGDKNADISGVAIDFSQFGGGVKAAAYDSNTGKWTAEYTIADGTTVDPGAAVSVVATDDAGYAIAASAFAPTDTSAPAVAVTAPAGHATSGPLAFAVHFSEAVTGFTADDVTVTGTVKGPLVAAVSGSGQDYTVTISGMKAGGTVTVAIAAGVAEDGAGNANLASGVAAVKYGGSTVAVYDPATATCYLRNSNDRGYADTTLDYGPDGSDWIVITGDWNGDGVDTVGLYDPTTSMFYLRNSNDSGVADVTFAYGVARGAHGDTGAAWTPIAGDWNGDGVDTIGLYCQATGTFYLRNTNTAGYADVTFVYGPAGNGWNAIAGDWNGDGDDTIGLYNQVAGVVYLRNTNATGFADVTFGYGPAQNDWAAVAGDWDGDGVDTIGLYSSANANFYLRNTNTAGYADNTFMYGVAGNGWTPIVGAWAAPSIPAAALTTTSAGVASPSAPAVAQSALDSIRCEAVRRWTASGVDAATLAKIEAATITVADLSGSNLAVIDHGTICIDRTAAGYGWFVDATPSSDEEFTASTTGAALHARSSSEAVDHIDLLTVLEQELGQIAGLDDLADCVVNGTIGPSVRSSLLMAM
jgi:hypothetical protein